MPRLLRLPLLLRRIQMLLLAIFTFVALSTVLTARFARLAHYSTPIYTRATPAPAAPTSRFLNAQTAEFLVHSLPDVPFDIGETYAGNLPIDSRNANRTLFFLFQPKLGAGVDEVVIWLNGGPGCSSLIGFFQENGRFVWMPGTGAVALNPYSWVNLTNVLWVDQPVGVGFSQGEPHYVGEEGVARDFVDWFRNWARAFGTSGFRVFVSGESYAGRYVPYIASEMVDRNDTEFLNLAGAMTVSGTIGSNNYVQELVPTYPWIEANNNILNLNASTMAQLAELDVSCGYKDFREKYYHFPATGVQPPVFFSFEEDAACGLGAMVVDAAVKVNPCFNLYNILDHCPLKSNILSASNLRLTSPTQHVYFDRADVKKALHAPVDTEWMQCTAHTIFFAPNDTTPEDQTGDASPDPIQAVLPKVIEHTNRVLITNGVFDFAILSMGTLLSIQNMTWNGQLGFEHQPATDVVVDLPDLGNESQGTMLGVEGGESQGVMGVQHLERGLMYVEVKGSGHMVPGDQPRMSWRQLEWLLGRREVL